RQRPATCLQHLQTRRYHSHSRHTWASTPGRRCRTSYTWGQPSAPSARSRRATRCRSGHVAIGVVERPNRSDVVEECIRIADPGSEPELIRDVFDAVAGVVNFELVQDVIPEPIEVRHARRILKGNPR